MNDNYMEYMVKKAQTPKDRILRFLFIFLTVSCVMGGIVIDPIILFLALVMWIVCKVVIFPMTDLEYEFLYCDRQITIDKIMGREKRKHVATYDVDRIEIMAPINSYRLDSYKKRNCTEKNFSSGEESSKHNTFAIFYEGNQKIILDLPHEFVKMIQNCAPRKVFFD